MFASAWESLSEWMVEVVLWVERLRPFMFWGVLLTVLLLFGLWLFKVFRHLGGHGPGLTMSESYQSSLLDRLDERACIAISRRPRRRKRRHHHRHQAPQTSVSR